MQEQRDMCGHEHVQMSRQLLRDLLRVREETLHRLSPPAYEFDQEMFL